MSSQGLSIAIRADTTGLSQGFAAALAQTEDFADAINALGATMANVFQAAGAASKGQAGAAQAASSAARAEAEKLIELHKQTTDAIVAGEMQLNASRLALGQETLAAFTQQELAGAKQKYAADLQALQQEEAIGKVSHAEYLAQKALLDQQYANKTAQIAEQAAQKQRAADDKAFANFQRAQENKFRETQTANAKLSQSGQVTVPQAGASDLQTLDAAKAAVDQQFATLTAGWDQQSSAYKAELEKRVEFDQWYAEQKKAIDAKLTQEDFAQWHVLNQEIESAESELVSDIFNKRQSLAKDLAQVGYKMLQDEVTNCLKMLTEHEMVNLGILDGTKATSEEGLLYKLGAYLADLAGLTHTEATKTATVTAGETARTAATAAGASAGKAIQAADASTSIAQDAGQAAAGVYASVSQIPGIGWLLAPIAAAGAFAAVMAYDSFAHGAWELPHDTFARVHKGETILNASEASDFRSVIGGAGRASQGRNVTNNHFHFAPELTGTVPRNALEELSNAQDAFAGLIQSMVRSGRLKVA